MRNTIPNMSFTHEKFCQYCNSTLTNTQAVAGDICDNINCRMSWLSDFQQQERQRKDKELELELDFEKKAKRYRDIILKDNVTTDIAAALGIVPTNEREITDLPRIRVEEFRKHLIECITDAQKYLASDGNACNINLSDTDSLVNTISSFEREALIEGCSTCRGYCCLGGGKTFAYQDAKNMFYYMQRVDSADHNTIINKYLSHIPAQSYENSCVYHTEAGCTLPRNMRAEICNKHLCKNLRTIKGLIYRSNPKAMFIVAENTHKITRSTLIGTDIPTQHFSGKDR